MIKKGSKCGWKFYLRLWREQPLLFFLQLLLIITCSASCEVHGEYLIKLAEVRVIKPSILQLKQQLIDSFGKCTYLD